MSVLSATRQASISGDEHSLRPPNSIGQLFRDWGEIYIDTFCPDLRTIKLIRAVRACRTPTLGGQCYECKDCGGKHYHYFSCGHSHCPICQGIKRMQWQDRLGVRMLPVPYAHITFTVPHELNGLIRTNPAVMFNLLFQSAWQTIRKLCADESNVGGLPGMTAVLHTWGSDLKYHVHLHCLVTFGGYDRQSGEWRWPKRKRKVARFRKLRGGYRSIFLEQLEKEMEAKKRVINYHESYEMVTKGLTKKSWVVNHQHPTADTKVIEEYLGRYICRIGITNKRLSYEEGGKNVRIEYNDYAKQVSGQPAPKAYRHLHPIEAMGQILQHLLPHGFHRSRHYGLHAANTYAKLAPQLPEKVKREGATVRTIIEILRVMLKEEPYRCPYCQSDQLEKGEVLPDRYYSARWLGSRAPPLRPMLVEPDFSEPELDEM